MWLRPPWRNHRSYHSKATAQKYEKKIFSKTSQCNKSPTCPWRGLRFLTYYSGFFLWDAAARGTRPRRAGMCWNYEEWFGFWICIALRKWRILSERSCTVAVYTTSHFVSYGKNTCNQSSSSRQETATISISA